MSAAKGLIGHAVALAVAGAMAVVVWTKDDAPKTSSAAAEEVHVWSGRPADIKKIELESDKRSLLLTAKKDGRGAYFVADLTKTVEPPSSPHAGPDGGASSQPKEPAKKETLKFVAVEAAGTLVEQLAPLKALRRVGKVGEERLEEFGLNEPEGTLKVSIGNVEHTMVIGGTTPGGGDRYVRLQRSELVYVLKGPIVRDVLTAETRLLERKLLGFEKDEVTSAKVTTEAGTRELLRKGSESKPFWTDPGSPEQQDETASNWMGKVDRLRVTEYIPESGEGAMGTPVASIEYYAGKKKLDTLQIVKLDETEGDKAVYAGRTEHTRWHAKITRSVAEQVAQDVGSVIQ